MRHSPELRAHAYKTRRARAASLLEDCTELIAGHFGVARPLASKTILRLKREGLAPPNPIAACS